MTDSQRTPEGWTPSSADQIRGPLTEDVAAGRARSITKYHPIHDDPGCGTCGPMRFAYTEGWRDCATDMRQRFDAEVDLAAVSRSATQDAGLDPKVVRAWARDAGVECPGRGKVPGRVVEAYLAAHAEAGAA